MTKLEEMIIIAQNISYIEPTSTNIDEWTSIELLHKSIYICNQFPPLKIIYKSILSGYIKQFMKSNSVST